MTVLTGGPPVLIEVDDITAGHRAHGYDDGANGRSASPPHTFTRLERAAYFRGHIRGTLARRKAERSTT